MDKKKLILEILAVIGLLFVILFLSVYFYLAAQGGDLVIKQLKAVTHKEVSVGLYSLNFPLTVNLQNVDIKGLAKADSVSASLSLLGLCFGKVVINHLRIIGPHITYERLPVKEGEVAKAAPSIAIPAGDYLKSIKPKKKILKRYFIKRISIKNGTIDIVDRRVMDAGLKFTIRDISLNLNNGYPFHHSLVSSFELAAKMPWQDGKESGTIKADGWVDFRKKDMEAAVRVEGIEGVYLYPYFFHYVDLDKMRIEKARLNFSGDIHGLNNNVTAECRLALVDIVFKQRPPEEEASKGERMVNKVLNFIKAMNQGKVEFNFTIRTKMDRPEFRFGDLQSVVENKFSEGSKGAFDTGDVLLALPAKLLEGAVNGALTVTTDIIAGTFEAGVGAGRIIKRTNKTKSSKAVEDNS